jgi:hypothetical protein
MIFAPLGKMHWMMHILARGYATRALHVQKDQRIDSDLLELWFEIHDVNNTGIDSDVAGVDNWCVCQGAC